MHRLGGPAHPHVADDRVVVEWTPDDRRPPASNQVVDWLRAGQVHEAVVALELLLGVEPDDPALLYNLGMAHSDLGNLDRAVDLLRRRVDVSPPDVNARVALGVALLRQGKSDDALVELERAVAEAPDNPWALRNLSAALLRRGETARAVDILRQVTELNSTDERAWLGLGQALEKAGDAAEADEAYKRAIDLAGFGEVAEAAKQGRGRIADVTFREKAAGSVRMDAVMYCLGAMECFTTMSAAERGQVLLEISVLGQQGLDVNDSTQTYRLRNLPGEFTALHLLSYLYVGMQQIDPSQDIGFDLAAEYEMARGIHEAEGVVQKH